VCDDDDDCTVNVIINNSNNTTTPHNVRCLWCCHHDKVIARVHPVYLMNVEQRQVAIEQVGELWRTLVGCYPPHPPFIYSITQLERYNTPKILRRVEG